MTERADPRYADIDRWDSLTALTSIWESQLGAVAAIAPALPALARATDAIAGRLRAGGRLGYAGAGTSIRIAVQDGTELGPTYDWPDARLLYLIAGGPEALMRSVEGAEDDEGCARAQVSAAGIGPDDVLIGVAASGRTPFTCAAIEAARAAGALTMGISCNADTRLLALAEHPVVVVTGAEPVAGSTRMKAGTVQKVLLNMVSTQVMIRLGRVHAGLMVDMRPQNAKLRARARDMVAHLAGVAGPVAESALIATGWQIKPAVLVAHGLDPAAAEQALVRAEGILRVALRGDGSVV